MKRRAAGKKTNYDAQLRGHQPHSTVLEVRTPLQFATLCGILRFIKLSCAEMVHANAKALVTSPPRELVHDNSAVLARGTKMYRTT